MILKLNKIQNNLQLIQIDKGYIVIDLIAEIKEGDFYLLPYKSIEYCCSKIEANNLTNIPNKIIFASQSLNLEGVKLIEENTDISDLAEIKRKEKYVDGSITTWVKNDWQSCYKEGFIEGYKQAKKNTYTLEQLKEGIKLAQNYSVDTQYDEYDVMHEILKHTHFESDIIESLNQPKVQITFDKNNQLLTVKLI